LGAPGNVLREEELNSFDVVRYFTPVYPRLLRFDGAHPPAALATLNRLNSELRRDHDLTARLVRAQPAAVKFRNLVRRLNYEVRWRSRIFNPLSRELTR
jgi:hypothetical protein